MADLRWEESAGNGWRTWRLTDGERVLVSVLQCGDEWPRLRVMTADSDGGALVLRDLDTALRVGMAIGRELSKEGKGDD